MDCRPAGGAAGLPSVPGVPRPSVRGGASWPAELPLRPRRVHTVVRSGAGANPAAGGGGRTRGRVPRGGGVLHPVVRTAVGPLWRVWPPGAALVEVAPGCGGSFQRTYHTQSLARASVDELVTNRTARGGSVVGVLAECDSDNAVMLVLVSLWGWKLPRSRIIRMPSCSVVMQRIVLF